MTEQLERTVRSGRGLPGWFFTSTEVLDAEKRLFFRGSWLCVGLSADVAEAGAVSPVSVVDQPLLIVRDRDSGIRVFHNVCSHRGAQLVDTPRKCNTIVCPYHGWSYAISGELKRTPHVGGEGVHESDQIDHTELGLKEVRSGVWAGLIFVNLSGEAPDLKEHLRPVVDRWRRVDLSLLEHVPDLGQRPPVKANWKLVVENFVESYHLPCVHKSMNAFNPMGAHYPVLGGEHYLGQGVKAHQPTDVYAGKFKPFPGLRKDELAAGESLYIPANLMLITMSDFMFANIVTPVSPGLTSERIEMFLIGDGATDPELGAERQKLMDMLSQVNDEDIAICERAQKGRSSEAFTGGVFAPVQEKTTLQFQQLVARKMLSGGGYPAKDLPELAVEDIHLQ